MNTRSIKRFHIALILYFVSSTVGVMSIIMLVVVEGWTKWKGQKDRGDEEWDGNKMVSGNTDEYDGLVRIHKGVDEISYSKALYRCKIQLMHLCGCFRTLELIDCTIKTCYDSVLVRLACSDL